jgi:hypothetical protein
MSLLAQVPRWSAGADVPVDLTRDEARRLAELELADPAYRAAQPTLVERVIAWVVEQVQEVVNRAAAAAPGGWLGILGLVALVVLAVLVVRWRLGPISGSARVTFTVDPAIGAAEYLARAEQLAADGRWEQAVAARMGALVRRCQERGLIDGRPGWTADEVAAEVAGHAPEARADLAGAAAVFDEVRYGGRVAGPHSYAAIARADERVQRLVRTGA